MMAKNMTKVLVAVALTLAVTLGSGVVEQEIGLEFTPSVSFHKPRVRPRKLATTPEFLPRISDCPEESGVFVYMRHIYPISSPCSRPYQRALPGSLCRNSLQIFFDHTDPREVI